MKWTNSLIHIAFILAVMSAPAASAMEKSKPETAEKLIKQGETYFDKGQYAEAVDYYLASMAQAKADDDNHAYARSVYKLGMVYIRLKDVERAIHYLHQAYEIAGKAHDKVTQGLCAAHLSGAYAFQLDLDNARKYLEEQRRLPHESEGLRRYFLYFNEAVIRQLEGDNQKALALHAEAIRTVNRFGLDKKYINSDYGMMVYLYLERKDTVSALEYCEKFKSVGERTGSTTYLYTYHEMLRDICKAKGQVELSRQHAQIADSIYMAVITQQQIDAVDNKVVAFQDGQSRQDINMLTSKVNRQLVVITLFVALVVVLITLMASIFIYVRKLRKTYNLLLKKNKELRLQEQLNHELRERHYTKSEAKPAGTAPGKLSSENHAATNGGGKEHQEAGMEREEKLTKQQAQDLLDNILLVMEDISVISAPDFSLNVLAQKVGSNTTYVSWIINNVYHHNFKTLLNEYRIKEACRRLEDYENYGHLTIQAVFKDLGYSSYSNFVATFKKINGMTPTQYQKIARSNAAKRADVS